MVDRAIRGACARLSIGCASTYVLLAPLRGAHNIARVSSRYIGGTAPSVFIPQVLRTLRYKNIHPSIMEHAPLSIFTPLGVENRAVAFQDRGPPGPYPSKQPQGVWGSRAPPLNKATLRSSCASHTAGQSYAPQRSLIECREAALFTSCKFLFMCGST